MLKTKIANIKKKFKNDPDSFITAAFVLTAATVSIAGTGFIIKKLADSLDVFVVDKDVVRNAEENDLAILFEFKNSGWFYKPFNPKK